MTDTPIITFTSPGAHVLLVDDMPVNNKVTEKLLQPLNMHIDLASNGKEALEKIFENDYDLVFMDHMMPVMDGMEAISLLRKRSEEVYKNLPVVVVTGNTTDEEKKHYLDSGFSDHLAKPITINDILSCILKWLPEEKILKSKDTEEKKPMPEDTKENAADASGNDASRIDIPGIDTAKGIKNSGGPSVFIELLGDVHELIDEKCRLIEKHLGNGDTKAFTTQVHALKTTCRMIGAMDLAEEFYSLEKLGNSEDTEKIKELAPGVLETFKALKPHLEPYARLSSEADKEFNRDEVVSTLRKLSVSIKDFELSAADKLMTEAASYKYPDELDKEIDSLKKLVSDIDFVEAKALIDDIISKLE